MELIGNLLQESINTNMTANIQRDGRHNYRLYCGVFDILQIYREMADTIIDFIVGSIYGMELIGNL